MKSPEVTLTTTEDWEKAEQHILSKWPDIAKDQPASVMADLVSCFMEGRRSERERIANQESPSVAPTENRGEEKFTDKEIAYVHVRSLGNIPGDLQFNNLVAYVCDGMRLERERNQESPTVASMPISDEEIKTKAAERRKIHTIASHSLHGTIADQNFWLGARWMQGRMTEELNKLREIKGLALQGLSSDESAKSSTDLISEKYRLRDHIRELESDLQIARTSRDLFEKGAKMWKYAHDQRTAERDKLHTLNEVLHQQLRDMKAERDSSH